LGNLWENLLEIVGFAAEEVSLQLWRTNFVLDISIGGE
jgi:hypothetical protein